MKSGSRSENLRRDVKKASNLQSGKENKVNYTFRILPSIRELLTKHFEEQDRSLANGITFILNKYIDDQGLK